MVTGYAIINTIDNTVSNVIICDNTWTVPDGYYKVLIYDDSSNLNTNATIGDTYNGTTFNHAPIPVVIPIPDGQGLLLSIFNLLGLPVSNLLLKEYPVFTVALSVGNWPLIRQIIDLALSDGVLPQVQHDAIVALMIKYNIP